MIQNKIVANVKSNQSEQELKNILTEYEKRLTEMEKDNKESYSKLKTLIEKLQKEKEDLNKRLIKANNNKLLLKAEDGSNGQSSNDEIMIEADNKSKSFVIMGCGIINSF